jgi:short-subunit dehydrogenase
MTTAARIRDTYALITGGSTGIGSAIAEALAENGVHLVLVARDAPRLQHAAAAIRSRHGVTVLPVPLDLGEVGAVARLLGIVHEAGIEIELLVNAAGMSARGMVADADPAVLRRLVDLNVGALTELTTAVVAQMVVRRRGSIVNVASTGAYAPSAVLAAYSASKAYVLSFTQALWAETRSAGVRVVAVSPGPTETPMNPGGGRGKRQPSHVAQTVLAALEKSGPAVVDGRSNSIVATLIRLVPGRVMAKLTLRVWSR